MVSIHNHPVLPCLACILALFLACSDSPTDSNNNGSGTHNSALLGRWLCVNYTVNGAHDEDGGLYGWEDAAWEFRADGTCIETNGASTEVFTWSTSGSTITMTTEDGSDTDTGTYAVQGETVTFTYAENPNYVIVITMQRE